MKVSSISPLVLALVLALAGPATTVRAEEHIVRVVSDLENLRMYFSPKYLVVAPGDTVTWVNEAAVDHNIVTFPDGFPKGAVAFSSPDLAKPQDKWSMTFTKAGTYEYHCMPHIPMGMHGVIIVGQHSADQDFHQPSARELADYRGRLLEYFDEDEYEYKTRDR